MKVLFIHCRYGFAGGEDAVVREETALLRKNGVDVRLLEFDNASGKISNLMLLPFNPRSYKKVRQECAGFRPDIAHVHNTHFAASPSVLYALRKSGVPVVCTLHNYRLLCPSATLYNKGKIFTDSLHRPFPWKAIARGVYRHSKILTGWLAISSFVHRRLQTQLLADRYIVLTNFARELFTRSSLNIPPDRFFVKPNFVSVRKSTMVQSHAGFLFIGRLTEEKGIKVLLEAFRGTSHQLTIAGEGPLEQLVHETVLGNSNIRFVGQVDKVKISSLIGNASALVFPSTWYEGMPVTIIEAFAGGCPVIASALGAMQSMVTDGTNGLLFRAGDANDLRKKLIQWEQLTHHDKSAFRTNAIENYHKNYTPERNFSQLASVYEDVLNDYGMIRKHPGVLSPVTTRHI